MASYHVLVVEDQLDARQVLRSGLESLGEAIQVIDLPSGEEALLVSSYQHIDLLVADIRLAGMSGLELMQKTRQKNPDLKVILITGLTDPDIRRLVASADAEAYFFKPIDIPRFLMAVEQTLGLEKSERPIQVSLPDEEASPPARSLPECLSNLRERLQAIAVILLDDQGNVIERAGTLEKGDTEAALLPAVMTLFTASARAGHILERFPPQDMLYIAGQNYDLYLVHVGLNAALLVVATASGEKTFQMELMYQLHPAAKEIAAILSEVSSALPLQTGKPAEPDSSQGTPPKKDTGELDEILQHAQVIELSADDLDEYWESATAQEAGNRMADQDSLTYDQAQRLGLAPE